MALETRALGSTGESVTVLGYGAMELRGVPRGRDISDDDAGKILNGVLDSGITMIDTSPDYGKSEDLIGKYLSGRRDEFFLASKCGCSAEADPSQPPPFPHIYTRQNIRAVVERSLRRLQTDRIDLVQIHMSPSREVLETEGTVEELQALRDEGKIRFIGMSGTLPNLPDHLAMGVFDAFQIPYSALQREHEELIAKAASAGAGTVIRGGVARGAAADSSAAVRPVEGGRERWEEANVDDLLQGMNPMDFMLRFTISHPGLNTTIVGTANLDHLRSNIEAASAGPLPADVYEAAKARFAD